MSCRRRQLRNGLLLSLVNNDVSFRVQAWTALVMLAEEKDVMLTIQAQHAATVRHVVHHFMSPDHVEQCVAFEWRCRAGHKMRDHSLVEEMLAHPLSALVAAVGSGEIEEVQDVSIEECAFAVSFLFRPTNRRVPQPAVHTRLTFEAVPDCSVASSQLIIGVDEARMERVRTPGESAGERCIEDWHFYPTSGSEREAGIYRLQPEV